MDALTLEEYRALDTAALRHLNDTQYGSVGGWDAGADGNPSARHYAGRPIVRCAEAGAESLSPLDSDATVEEQAAGQISLSQQGD